MSVSNLTKNSIWEKGSSWTNAFNYLRDASTLKSIRNVYKVQGEGLSERTSSNLVAAEDFPKTTYGLCNVVQIYQRFIHSVLPNLHFFFVYLNDILIASFSEFAHLDHHDCIFQRLLGLV